jgi:hypothetical protein
MDCFPFVAMPGISAKDTVMKQWFVRLGQVLADLFDRAQGA